MALKLAETGSTWFASLLAATPSYKIEEEIYTKRHSDISLAHKTDKLISVLSCSYFSDSRRPVHGFTINPKNNMGIDWSHVVKASKANVVIWRRSNIVKTAVSIYRKSVQHLCDGKANLRHDSSCVDEKVRVDVTKYLEKVHTQAHYYAELEKAARMATTSADGRNISIFYEDMQDNQQREMDRLAVLLGNASYSGKQVHADTVKKTTDDLKDIIVNFDEVLVGLEKLQVPAKLNCPLVEMLQQTGFKVYHGCDYEGLAVYLTSIGVTAK